MPFGPTSNSGSTFGSLGGIPSNNVALAEALAAKLDKVGGAMTGALTLQSVVLSGASPACLKLGADHGTTPTHQTIVSHSVTTGIGADLVLGAGAGSVAGGGVAIATRATNGALLNRVRIGSDGVWQFYNTTTGAAGVTLSNFSDRITCSGALGCTDVLPSTITQRGGSEFVRLGANGTLSFYSNADVYAGVLSISLGRTADANLRMGLDAASSQVSQIFHACGPRIGTDVNTTPSNTLTIAGPHCTGTGTGGDLRLGVYGSNGSSGTAIGTLNAVLTIVAAGQVLKLAPGYPTSSAGRSSGEIYINGGVLTVVP